MNKRRMFALTLLLFSFLIISPLKVYGAANSMSEVIDVIRDEYQLIITGKNKKLEDKNYDLISYEDIMRERNGFSDRPHTLYATVQQYEEIEDQDVAYGLVKRDGDLDKAYYVFFPKLPKNRLMIDDRIDLYGTLHGLYSYETVIGGSKTVPVLLVHKVLVEGIDY